MSRLQKRYRNYVLSSVPKLPKLFLQARRVLKDVPKLPEAADPIGHVADGKLPPFRLLFVGESTMAGVGVQNHKTGFAGHFARELARQIEKEVYWSVVARSGATVSKINQDLLYNLEPKAHDLVVVGIGANDAFKMSTLSKWQRSIDILLHKLHHLSSGAAICFISMPPVQEFPALTSALKDFLSEAINIFSDDLKERITRYDRVWYDARTLVLADWEERTGIRGHLQYFSDGVHPSELTYRLWAEETVQFVLRKELPWLRHSEK